MKCSEIQFDLPVYADGALDAAGSDAVRDHLTVCPLCRQKKADYQDIRVGLSAMQRVEIPASLRNSIKRSVRTELVTTRRAPRLFTPDMREWLQMRVMPYGVGVFASLLIGLTFMTMMFSSEHEPLQSRGGSQSGSGDTSFLLASNSNPFTGAGPAEISPRAFAQSRLAFADESPSINPQGALIALTKSLIRGGMKDDEVVVVADVFGSGLARIAEVVEPSSDIRAVQELEKALQTDSAFSPFVPANMETRPDSVRVVLKFQSVNVSTRSADPRPRRR